MMPSLYGIVKEQNVTNTNITRKHDLLDLKKTKPRTGQFDHLIILNKSIWTCPTWLVVCWIDHKMVFLTSQIGQKFG